MRTLYQYALYTCILVHELTQQAQCKMVLKEEQRSIDMQQVRKATSRSSSGSSFDKPTSDLVQETRARSHSQLWHENTQLHAQVEDLQREVSELKEAGTSKQKAAEKYFEQVTTSTKMVSDAEEREKRLKMEKSKLERKLKEAEEVAAQAETAVAQVHTMPYSTVCGCIYTCTVYVYMYLCTFIYTCTCTCS